MACVCNAADTSISTVAQELPVQERLDAAAAQQTIAVQPSYIHDERRGQATRRMVVG